MTRETYRRTAFYVIIFLFPALSLPAQAKQPKKSRMARHACYVCKDLDSETEALHAAKEESSDPTGPDVMECQQKKWIKVKNKKACDAKAGFWVVKQKKQVIE